jgi:RND family efflux transporter MFP subunit
MSRVISTTYRLCSSALLLAAIAMTAAACSGSTGEARGGAPPDVKTVTAETTPAVEQAITRFVDVTGTLTAEEQADVSAEVAGRVMATPVERGTRVAAGTELIRISDTEVRAQVAEAEANASQIEARLGMRDGASFDIDRVPEVASAKASSELAQADFERARMLNDRKLLSQADFDRSRTQADSARRQYDSSRNNAEQQFQALLAARARLVIARKALVDTSVRAPFAGVVEQRLVSAGDYVTRGTKIASVMRINPLRVELTVPQQSIAAVTPGHMVVLRVDAYPDRTFTGQIRYVSPAVKTDSRTLLVEAVVPNDNGELRPGFFATAQIEQPSKQEVVLVPAAAVQTVAGTSRVFVASGTVAEERIVTTGQTVGDLVEITTGVKSGESVITTNLGQLSDGVKLVANR